MAIESISIHQDNFINGSNLVTVHNPLVFLVDASYTGDIPDYSTVYVKDGDGTTLGLYRCVFDSDITPGIRRFAFFADEILKGLMGVFDDVSQSGMTIEFVEDITKEFTLVFNGTVNTELDIVAIHASKQFGEYPNLDDVFNNEAKTYQGYEDKPCYVYFYNDDETNVISVTQLQVSDNATDSDAAEFTDSDAQVFTILIPA